LHYAKSPPIIAPDTVKAVWMTKDAREAALADLCEAVSALTPHLHSADDQAALSRLKAEVGRLSRPAVPATGISNFDPTRFQRLIDMAGPTMAGTLLEHLANDLGRCRSLAINGAADLDWDALRESSHILISLAGSVGALSLQAMAETLNAAAQAEDAPTTRATLPALGTELDALIALVGATPTPDGGAA
jgi:hypothetical protein